MKHYNEHAWFLLFINLDFKTPESLSSRFTCDLEKWLTLQDWEVKLVVDAQEYFSHLLLSEGSCLV